MRTKTKSLYDYRGYHGIDASLDISLFEYGLICRKFTKSNIKKYEWKKLHQHSDEYRIIYGVETDEQGNYNLFEPTYKRESELNNLVLGNEWISKDVIDSFLETHDTTLETWLELSFIMKLHDLVSHFGWMDVLGSVYYGFKINN